MQKKILFGDDHLIIRQGLKTLFEHYFNITHVTEASSCAEIMKELSRSAYSHIVLDVVLSDGSILEILPNIVNLYPHTKILIFSMQPAEIYRRVLFQYGIGYYLSKTSLQDETISLFSKFLNNEDPPEVAGYFHVPENPFSDLTARELEILHYILKGMSSKEIGDTLNLKLNTISTVKNRVFEKTGTENIRELFDLATMYNVI